MNIIKRLKKNKSLKESHEIYRQMLYPEFLFVCIYLNAFVRVCLCDMCCKEKNVHMIGRRRIDIRSYFV
ncbi:hypothetical protein PUN28_005732 [Cardiocondyla obscurior]|uniref:Uncharacterized protein n=1 Tax=Cardiocondyla obscurior TaxID=286306 RepID=A0AAW2GA61_9HYME